MCELVAKEVKMKEYLSMIIFESGLSNQLGLIQAFYIIFKFETGGERLKASILTDSFIRTCKRGVPRRPVLVGLIDLVQIQNHRVKANSLQRSVESCRKWSN